MNENTNGFKELTETQKAKIANNLAAYTFHFETPVIVGINYNNNIIYIFKTKEDFEKSSYEETHIQKCPNIDYVNGWLYGAVQCKVGRIPHLKEVK